MSVRTKYLVKLSQDLCPDVISLSPQDQLLKEKLESSLYEFVKWSWEAIEGVPFVPGWHIEAICRHLELAAQFKMKSLIINIPPRCSKSTILSMWNAWIWCREPYLKFLCISGTKSLAVKDSDRCKRIIEWDEYKKLWGDKVQIRYDSNAKQKFETTAHGQRLSKSMQGNVRGEGGNFIVLDDPNTDAHYTSDVMREAANEYLDSNISLRESDPKKTVIVICQQRIHQFDITGHTLAKGGSLVYFRLPMEYEPLHSCVTIPLRLGEQPWQDPRTKEGELLWPERFDAEAVARLKQNLRSEYHISAQMQQIPSPRQGGIIKKEWFKKWERVSLPHVFFRLTSWDTAITINKDSCYSACTTWGIFQDDNGYNNLILLNCWRGKLEYPDLKEMIQRCSEDYMCQSLQGNLSARQPDKVLIEKGANGMPLIQDLFRSGLRATPFDPRHHGFKSGHGTMADNSKVGRAKIASSIIEDGLVWIPMDSRTEFRESYPYVKMFLEATTNFPRGDGADLVDSMSQAFISLMQNGDISYHGQKPEEEKPDWRQESRHTSRLLEKSSNLYGRV